MAGQSCARSRAEPSLTAQSPSDQPLKLSHHRYYDIEIATEGVDAELEKRGCGWMVFSSRLDRLAMLKMTWKLRLVNWDGRLSLQLPADMKTQLTACLARLHRPTAHTAHQFTTSSLHPPWTATAGSPSPADACRLPPLFGTPLSGAKSNYTSPCSVSIDASYSESANT